MWIHTDPVPTGPYRDVVVLVDVLRTCTVAPMLFDRGVAGLALTPSLRRARAAGADGALLIGERQGIPPEGFHHGNSPALLLTADVSGRSVVMVSENAPRWLEQVAKARHVLLASLSNAEAVAKRAAELAHERIDLVGSGFQGEPDLDDTLAAGLLAGLLLTHLPSARPSGATLLATNLLRALPDPLDGLWNSTAGLYLRTIGLEHDLAVAAQVSVSDTVPELVGVEQGEPAPLYRFAPAGARGARTAA